MKCIALYSAQIVPSNLLIEASQCGHVDPGDLFITKQTTEQTPEAGSKKTVIVYYKIHAFHVVDCF